MNNSPNSHWSSSFWDKNWLSFFWCGGIAVIFSWALSGCRFGNHEVDPPSTGPFFYETALTTIQICANFTNGTQTCATETNPNFLPNLSLMQGTDPSTGDPNLGQLPDPVEIAIDPNTANQYDIGDPVSGAPYFYVNYDSQNNLGLDGVLPATPIFLDPQTGDATCNMNISLQIAGELTTTGPYTTNFSAAPLNGRMPLEIEATLTPQGTGCQAAVTCLFDQTGASCDGNSKTIIADYYQNLVSANLATTSATLETVTSWTYGITYQ
jgi:hypothetical protein